MMHHYDQKDNFIKGICKIVTMSFDQHVSIITSPDVASQFAYTFKHLLSNKLELQCARDEERSGTEIGNC